MVTDVINDREALQVCVETKRQLSWLPEDKMQQVIIFDVDGTLLDSVDAHARAWVDTFTSFGINVPLKSMRHLIGMGGDRIIRLIAPELSSADGMALTRQRSDLFLHRYFQQVTVFPHVVDFFIRLRIRGVRFALGSAASDTEMEAYKTLIGVGELAIPQSRSAYVKASKPAPDVFIDAMQQLDAPRSECFVIGDSVYDVRAAKRAGMNVLGVCTGAFTADELMAAGCDATHDNVQAIYDLFRQTGSVVQKET